MPYVDGAAGAIWVTTLGAGAPVTVMVHGLGSSSADLLPLAEHLPGTRVLMDMRGHGRSETPPEDAGYDHPAMRADVEAVADQVGATHAIGVSMGAGSLMNLLADRPDRFARVVMLIPSRIDDPCPDVEGTVAMSEHLETLPLETVADRLLSMPLFDDLFARKPRWKAHMRDQLLRMNAVGIPRAFRAYARGAPPVPDEACLRAVAAPVLVVARENDPTHPAEIATRLGDVLQNAEVHVYPDDYAMFFDDVAEFGALVARFLTDGPP